MKMFILKVYAIACSIFFMLFPNFSKTNLAALFEMSPRFAFVLAELQDRRDLSRSRAILGPLERLGESSGFSYPSVGKSPRFVFVLAELQVWRDLSRSSPILDPLERLGESSGFSYLSVGK